MNLINKLVLAYFVAILVLFNCSLLFCDDKEHCVYPLKELPVSKETAYLIRVSISNFIPLKFKTIQQIAQWVVLVEIGLVLYFLMGLLRSIVSFICQLFFLFALIAIAYMAYKQYERSPEEALGKWRQMGLAAWNTLQRIWQNVGEA